MSEWTLTKDRLPDRTGAYWVTDTTGRKRLAYFWTENGVWRWHYSVTMCVINPEEIVAWTPKTDQIPCDYEGGEDNG